ncbi:MAG: NADH-quinone oxidoreductase subunit M [Burkholderiales bacterium]
MGLLSLAIWIPIVSGTLLFALGSDEQAKAVRWMALIAALAGFLVTLPLITGFDTTTAAMQFEENLPWIKRLNMHYHLGVDGLSVWFVLLTSFITLVIVIAGWEAITDRVAQYMASFLILSGLMVGVFSALDGMLFYIFFEATLIPMYIIVGVWGGPNRIFAAFKFFLYTFAGSLLMLIAMIYLYYKSGGSFDIQTWHALPLSMTAQTLLFFGFFAAFSVKVPMFPVHTWLPLVHPEAPTGGSAVLAAVMLKLGAYGFVRFSLPIAPDASHEWAWLIITLSLIAVIYIGFVAIVQKDMKVLIAYSSIAHMGFVTLGFFIFNDLGIAGGLLQMISHGFISAAMFLCIGVLYDRMHTHEIARFGGVVNKMPVFTAFIIFFAMANVGLPGTSGFVGEWTVILASVRFDFWIGLLAAFALFLGASYTLWMVKRVYFGPIGNDEVRALRDINAREVLMLVMLGAAVLWMGVYPKPFTDVMQTSVAELLRHVSVSKLN